MQQICQKPEFILKLFTIISVGYNSISSDTRKSVKILEESVNFLQEVKEVGKKSCSICKSEVFYFNLNSSPAAAI
jgi:hypothetical protein